ncbi:MAG: hypothetical protein M3160_01160 [Candidatus Eremiobacteraeota bacterium]|nr:hypothetical protein [Candidatus Eremiobacteraeota bacterium]
MLGNFTGGRIVNRAAFLGHAGNDTAADEVAQHGLCVRFNHDAAFSDPVRLPRETEKGTGRREGRLCAMVLRGQQRSVHRTDNFREERLVAVNMTYGPGRPGAGAATKASSECNPKPTIHCKRVQLVEADDEATAIGNAQETPGANPILYKIGKLVHEHGKNAGGQSCNGDLRDNLFIIIDQ